MTDSSPTGPRRPRLAVRWRQRMIDSGADPTAVPPPRGRTGYTLRQRYWAALTGRRLPPKPGTPEAE